MGHRIKRKSTETTLAIPVPNICYNDVTIRSGCTTTRNWQYKFCHY